MVSTVGSVRNLREAASYKSITDLFAKAKKKFELPGDQPEFSKCTMLLINSRKSVRWSAVPVPCLSCLWLKLRGEQGSGPKGGQ